MFLALFVWSFMTGQLISDGITCAARGVFQGGFEKTRTHLPVSKAGDAIGISSVVMVNNPSNFLSGKGMATSAEMRAVILGRYWSS